MSRAFVLFLLLAFAGCSGSHCLKIGGSYDGIDGNIEYCFSKEKTEKNGIPTLTGDKEDKVLVEESTLEKLISKVEGIKPLENRTLMDRLKEATKE